MLINGMMGKSLTGDQIKQMVVPVDQDPTTETIPDRAAKALGVNIHRIIGPGHSDDKLMVIWLEAILADPVAGKPAQWLAMKYNMPIQEMKARLADVSERFKDEPHLKIIVAKLQKEFEYELNENLIEL
jgi:hypothetical protein